MSKRGGGIATMDDQFFTKKNIETLVQIFQEYMKENYQIVFRDNERVMQLRKDVFTAMKTVHSENPQYTLDKKNITVLGQVKNMYMKQAQPQSETPQQSQVLRDSDIYKDRRVVIDEIVRPHSTTVKEDAFENAPQNAVQNLETSMNTLKMEREPRRETPDPKLMKEPEKVSSESASEFMAKLAELENARKQTEEAFKQKMKPVEEDVLSSGTSMIRRMDEDIQTQQQMASADIVDNQALYRASVSSVPDTTASDRKDRDGQTDAASDNVNVSLEKIKTSRQEILPPQVGLRNVKKYMTINSSDRDWEFYPKRYQYSISFSTDFQRRYRDITEVCVANVIIPEEINLKWTAETQKPNYNYDFSFAHPYLHLIIEEFGNVYDGTNDISRRSFCKLIFDKKYCTPNGRSFLILKPMQGETKLFYPSPLSSMPRLTMSLVRPTGQLLNDSYDAYKIFKIDYEVFNANYLAIVSDEYFDRNEYYVGDTVVLKGFTGPLHQDLVNFINRPEGHEVLELGTANENGYYRSFYIQTLGVFDKKQGSFNVDTDAITALNNYNNTIDYETTTDTNGVIMNLSLQHSISMNLVTREADVGHQSTNLFTQRS